MAPSARVPSATLVARRWRSEKAAAEGEAAAAPAAEAAEGEAAQGHEEALAALRAELDEVKSALQYKAADAENVRRRLQREIGEAREFAIRKFAKDLLDVSDDFERALEAAKADAEVSTLI